MPSFRSSARAARRLLPLATLLAVGLTPASALAAKKGPAPRLTIENRVCATGLQAADRSLTATANAVLRKSGGDRVALRFNAQQRGPGAKKWTRVQAAAEGGLGKWEIGQPGGVGLSYTKTLAGLAEETRYRLTVETRGLSADGKVVTRTAKRTIPCNQPRQNADVRLRKVEHVAPSGAAGDTLRVRIYNPGFVAAGKSLMTLRDGDGATVATKEVAPLRGRASRTASFAIPRCESGMTLVIEPLAGADGEPETSAHVVELACATGKQARRAAKPSTRR